jgi:hypothetical protein
MSKIVFAAVAVVGLGACLKPGGGSSRMRAWERPAAAAGAPAGGKEMTTAVVALAVAIRQEDAAGACDPVRALRETSATLRLVQFGDGDRFEAPVAIAGVLEREDGTAIARFDRGSARGWGFAAFASGCAEGGCIERIQGGSVDTGLWATIDHMDAGCTATISLAAPGAPVDHHYDPDRPGP